MPKVRPLLCAVALLMTPVVAQSGPAAGPSVEATRTRLWTDPVSIVVRGLSPGAKVVIEASLTDDAKVRWSSRGVYYAGLDGVVDVGKTASVSGTYTGIDAHGLFWSMLPFDAAAVATDPPRRLDSADPRTPVLALAPSRIEIVATSAGRRATTTTEAGYLAPGSQRQPLENMPLKGVLFDPPGAKARGGVVVITGSGGGINEKEAALLAARGFSVLALAHFNYPGRPAELIDCPLEYFRDALDFMRRHVGGGKVALIGASRGGEGTLLIASTYPERVSAVVASVPSNVVWGGCCSIAASARSAWTLNGRPIPRATPDQRASSIARDRYLTAMLNARPGDPSTIPVERIKAPVMLISGDADELWPSAVAADLVARRLRATHFRYPLVNLVYSGAGHNGFLPVTSGAALAFHNVAKGTINMGGEPSRIAFAGRDGFDRRMAFLTRYLKGPVTATGLPPPARPVAGARRPPSAQRPARP